MSLTMFRHRGDAHLVRRTKRPNTSRYSLRLFRPGIAYHTLARAARQTANGRRRDAQLNSRPGSGNEEWKWALRGSADSQGRGAVGHPASLAVSPPLGRLNHTGSTPATRELCPVASIALLEMDTRQLFPRGRPGAASLLGREGPSANPA